MGSLSFSEIVVIVLVILIVFGPNRLPDLARKAGEFMSKVRNASSTMTDALGVDYEETVEPFVTAKRDFDSIKTDITKTVTTFGQAMTVPDGDETKDRPDEHPEDTNDGERTTESTEPNIEASAVDDGTEAVTGSQTEPPDHPPALS